NLKYHEKEIKCPDPLVCQERERIKKNSDTDKNKSAESNKEHIQPCVSNSMRIQIKIPQQRSQSIETLQI
ncbi:hypothetical protein K1T71_014273, partial [Dendrolimus kikuchii]